MKKLAFVFVLVSAVAFGQTPAPPKINTFALALSPVAVSSKIQSVAGTSAGAMVTITNNFDIGNMDIMAPGNNFQYFSGRFNYRIPYLSKGLNNVSPTVNGLKFQFGVTGSVGIDRITTTSATHAAFTAGGFANYSLDSGAHYTLGAEVQYAKFVGMNNNTFIVSLGPAVHF